MLTADYTKQFKKDYKSAIKRGFNMSLIDNMIRDLINEKPLHGKHKDHPLTGSYAGYLECHIKPDWLLIYQTGDGIIVFERTGSHSDLF